VVFSLTDKVNFYESIFGRGRLSGNGKNFDVRCPICSPADASKKKLAIRTSDDANHCWTCGWKARSLAPLIRKYGTNSQLSSYKELFGLGDSKIITAEVEAEKKIELPKDFCLLTLSSTSDPDVKAAWNYVESRGLTEKDAWYFKFGLSNETRWKRRIMMPSFNDRGHLNYFAARAIDPTRRPKYDNPDVDKNPIVFNEINIDWSKRLVLCEGPFDLVKCTENSTALLGSDLDERHELFNKILIHQTPVALALDGDMWNKKTPKIVKKLQEYNVDVIVVDVRPWGDPGAMTKKEFEDALINAKPMEWVDLFSNRLEKVTSSSFVF
jgi:DNA primase